MATVHAPPVASAVTPVAAAVASAPPYDAHRAAEDTSAAGAAPAPVIAAAPAPSPAAPPPAAPRHALAPGLRAFEPFLRAERLLLRALQRGSIARVGLQRPTHASPAYNVRAALLAYLARGGAIGAPGEVEGVAGAATNAAAPARPVLLLGAWITGALDLGDAQVPHALWFYRCVFDQPLGLQGLRLAGHLSLRDCELPALHAERCEVRGDFNLDAGTRVLGEVRLRSARIGGDLDLSRARLAQQPGASRAVVRPLVADGAHVRGDVRLHGGVEAIGEMRWVGARVDGDFDARRARLTGHIDGQGQRRDALNLDRIQIGGDLLLGEGFAAAGSVRAVRALVGGDLDCSQAAFDIAGDSTWGEDSSALRLDRASIGGALKLRGLTSPIPAMSLEDVRVSTLDDDDSTWDEELVLDGLHYQRYAPTSPADSEFRVQWLQRQRPPRAGAGLAAQPWVQAISVLHSMGQGEAARRVAIARERQRRVHGEVGKGLPLGLQGLARVIHALWGGVAAYGHRPGRLLLLMGLALVLCAAVFHVGHRYDAFVPLTAASVSFSPLAYSLERLLPGLDLGLGHWIPAAFGDAAPLGRGMQWLGWIESLLGWVGLALLLGALLRRWLLERTQT
jgi:hypothetical protein